jgi:hypothetical protein
MKTELEIYLGAKEILSSADKWTKGVFARYKDGQPCEKSYYDPGAVCFCLSAALNISSRQFVRRCDIKQLTRAVEELAIDMPADADDKIVYFNDAETTTYEDVIRLLDTAITNVSAQ